MNTDNIIPSILHVTAKEDLNIDQDMANVQTKSIATLILDQKDEEKKEEPETNGQ